MIFAERLGQPANPADLRQTVAMAHASSRTHHHSRDRLIHGRVYDLGNGLLGRAGSDSAPRWPMIFSCNVVTGSSMWAVAPAAL